MSSETLWYLTRASALTAWVFLTLTVIWGALASSRLVRRRGGQRWLLDLHPYLGSLGLLALGVHLVTAVADSYVGLGWVDTVVPFTSPWEPLGVAVGVLAVWLLAAVQLSSVARRRLSRATWHRIHVTSYVAAWATAVHAVMVGTDLRSPVVAWGALALVALSTGAAVVRTLTAGRPARPVGAGVTPAGVRRAA